MEANVIKRDCPVMVMIGNPPYSISSQNNGDWITNLISDYKKDLNERNIQPLSDDYIKFYRLGQYYINKNGEGILAFISNNSFINGVIQRQMRKSLLDSYDKIYILDLHGNTRKHETCPDGSRDENVFDIMQGVSINIFVKTGKKQTNALAQVFHHEIYGIRQDKYNTLDSLPWSNDCWQEVFPEAPNYFFVPKDDSLLNDYEKGFKIDELFHLCSSGITTSNDSLLMDFTREKLKEKLAQNSIEPNEGDFYLVSYKPFDIRHYYLNPRYALRSRPSLIKNFKRDNLAMHWRRTAENSENWQHVFVSKYPSEGNFHSARSYTTPLYIHEGEENIPNFNPDVLKQIEQSLGEQVEPQDLFDYIYAVLHSPIYRERYKEFLKIDFPRIPYPTDAERYHALAALGAKLRKLHLMEGLPSNTGVTFPVAGTTQVDCYRWEQNRVYINNEQYFEGVPESAWNFYIGGYQPAQKWLKDRKGMTLGFEDVMHYQRIIYVLLQTERLMQEIDDIVMNNV